MAIKKYVDVDVETDGDKTVYVWGYWNKVNYDLIAIELSVLAPLMEQYDNDTMALKTSPHIDNDGRLILLTATIKPSYVTTAVVTVYLNGFDQHDPSLTKFAATVTVNGDRVFSLENPMTGSLYGGLSTAAILELMLNGLTMGYNDTDDEFFADNSIPPSWADSKNRHRNYLSDFRSELATHFELW